MELKDATEEVLELGTCLGRKQAFGLIASRCSAADAECLREIRENRRYRALGINWEEFCENRVGISRTFADKIIRQLEELGPNYFKLANFTRIKPADYRRIAPAVTEAGLSFGGETIALEAENAPKLAEAVDALRRECTPGAAPSDPAEESFAKAERSLNTAMAEFERLCSMGLDDMNRSRLQALVELGRHDLLRISLAA